MEIRDAVYTQYLVRNTYAEKRSFRFYFSKVLQSYGYEPIVQSARIMGVESNNLIGGSLRHCKTVFLLSYDTPKTRFVPQFRLPGRPGLQFFLNLLPMLLLAGIAALLVVFLRLPVLAAELLFLGSAFALYYLVNNKNNYNSSSPLLVLNACLERMPQNPGIAVVLLDNSDLFSLGRRAFFKEYGSLLAEKNMIFLDFSGRGDTVFVEYTKKASPMARLLESESQEPAPVLWERKRPAEFSLLRFSCAGKSPLGYSIGAYRSESDTYADSGAIEAVIQTVLRLFA